MADVGDGDRGVGLAAAIDQVRAELALAIEQGRDSPVKFRAGPVELEFQVDVARTTSGDGGVRVWVISLGAKREHASTETHRVKIVLTPVGPGGGDQLIGSEGTK